MPPFEQAPRLKKMRMHAILETSRGRIMVRLHQKDAPQTVSNFVKLARDRFYDGTQWHRVIDHFVIQGGCPKGDGTGGPGYTIPLEKNERKHTRGVLAMARAAAEDSGGSQFYITRSSLPHLDGSYCVFGTVTAGLEVVDTIEPQDKLQRVSIVEE